MRVQAEYQGRGYGQLILDELETRARALGYRTVARIYNYAHDPDYPHKRSMIAEAYDEQSFTDWRQPLT